MLKRSLFQDVSQDLKASSKRWKDNKTIIPRQPSSPTTTSDKTVEKSKALLYKKLEERNASITNAKHRWNFLKKKTLVDVEAEDPGRDDHFVRLCVEIYKYTNQTNILYCNLRFM